MGILSVVKTIDRRLEIIYDALIGLIGKTKSWPKDIGDYLYFEFSYNGVRGGEFYLNGHYLGVGYGDGWVSERIKDDGTIVKQTNYGEIKGSYSGTNPGLDIWGYRYKENKDDDGITIR